MTIERSAKSGIDSISLESSQKGHTRDGQITYLDKQYSNMYHAESRPIIIPDRPSFLSLRRKLNFCQNVSTLPTRTTGYYSPYSPTGDSLGSTGDNSFDICSGSSTNSGESATSEDSVEFNRKNSVGEYYHTMGHVNQVNTVDTISHPMFNRRTSKESNLYDTLVAHRNLAKNYVENKKIHNDMENSLNSNMNNCGEGNVTQNSNFFDKRNKSSLFVRKISHPKLNLTRSLDFRNLKPDTNSINLSKSLENFNDIQTSEKNTGSSLSSDDDDPDDDFDILNLKTSTCTFTYPSGMQKVKTPSPGHSIIPKKWRRSKLSNAVSSQTYAKYSPVWNPEGDCTWNTSDGQAITLSSTNFINLTDIEYITSQKIALRHLQASQLGCSISIPKDMSPHKRSKRSAFSLKRKPNPELNTNNSTGGKVFGISLSRCCANDQEIRRRRPSFLNQRRDSDLSGTHRSTSTRKSSNSSVSSIMRNTPRCRSMVDSSSRYSVDFRSISQDAGAISSDSLTDSADNRSIGSSLLDALSLSSSTKLDGCWADSTYSSSPHAPQVPNIVECCCSHLEEHGLKTLGIFRIGCSKKRTKQLKEIFDSGVHVSLDETHNPHDVAALLKEYLRDLPDCLLCRELYSAFITASKIKSKERRLAILHMLINLLPLANRDTLYRLMKFLYTITEHSTDTIDANGETIPGNKMDSHNLATLFGPNLLNQAKGVDFEVEILERAEERKFVIEVLKEIIENYKLLFEVSPEEHNEVLRYIHATNPEYSDILLHRIIAPSSSDNGDSGIVMLNKSESEPNSPLKMSSTSHSFNDALALHTKCLLPAALGSMSPSICRGQQNYLTVPQFYFSNTDNCDSTDIDVKNIESVSPRISPSPKAMKPGLSKLKIRSNLKNTIDFEDGHQLSRNAQALISPQASRAKRIPCSPNKENTAFISGNKSDNDFVSRSSSPSKLFLQKHSGNHPPCCHHGNSIAQGSCNCHLNPWYPETPPTTPYKDARDSLHTSSNDCSNCSSPTKNNYSLFPEKNYYDDHNFQWQRDRWKEWEKLAKEHGEKFNEQETLV